MSSLPPTSTTTTHASTPSRESSASAENAIVGCPPATQPNGPQEHAAGVICAHQNGTQESCLA